MQHYRCRRDGKYMLPYKLGRKTAQIFEGPADTNGLNKLYVVGRGDEFCYVGVTKRPMAARIAEHLRSPHGAPWDDLVDVDLYVFPLASRNVEYIEGVEAELVFLVRKHQGKWPTHQHEIHFRHLIGMPISRCRKKAESIYRTLAR